MGLTEVEGSTSVFSWIYSTLQGRRAFSMAVLIQRVEQGSPAARAGVRSGDTLLSVNGHPINDVLDYRFYCTERKVALVLLRDGAPYHGQAARLQE